MPKQFLYPADVKGNQLDLHDGDTVDFVDDNVAINIPIAVHGKGVNIHHEGRNLIGAGDDAINITVDSGAELNFVPNSASNPSPSTFAWLNIVNNGSLHWGGHIRCDKGFSLISNGNLNLGYFAPWMIQTEDSPFVDLSHRFPHSVANGIPVAPGQFTINGTLSGAGVMDGNLYLGPRATWSIPPGTTVPGSHQGDTPQPSQTMCTVIGSITTSGCNIQFNVTPTYFGQFVCYSNINLGNATMHVYFDGGTPFSFSNLKFIRAKTLSGTMSTNATVYNTWTDYGPLCTQNSTEVSTNPIEYDVEVSYTAP